MTTPTDSDVRPRKLDRVTVRMLEAMTDGDVPKPGDVYEDDDGNVFVRGEPGEWLEKPQ